MFTEIKFRSVLEEPTYEDGIGDRSKVTRILLTSGKIYYELAARKAKDNRDDIAIAAIETALARRLWIPCVRCRIRILEPGGWCDFGVECGLPTPFIGASDRPSTWVSLRKHS